MSRFPFRKATAALGSSVVLVLLAAGSAFGADAIRGRALYEARCDGCHSASVHQRVARKAGDFAGIRLQVERWDGQLGRAWRREEIDDVVVYLNERFYKYPCPESLCRAGAAQKAMEGAVLADRGELGGGLAQRAQTPSE